MRKFSPFIPQTAVNTIHTLLVSINIISKQI